MTNTTTITTTITAPLVRVTDRYTGFDAINNAMEHLDQATYHRFGIAQRDAARDPQGAQHQRALLRRAVTNALPAICTYAGLDPQDRDTLDALHLRVRQVIDWTHDNRLSGYDIVRALFA